MAIARAMSSPQASDAVTNRDVAKGAGTTLIARLGSVIDIVAQPLYVWLFGLAGYGLYAVLWATVNLIENIADLGQTSALQRTVPQAQSERDAVYSLRTAMLLGVGPCIAIAALTSLFAPALTHVFNAADADAGRLAHIIAVFAWALPLWAFVEVGTSALRARRVFAAEIRLRLFWEQVTRLAFAIGFWAAGFGTLSLFYAHVASLAAMCVLCVRLMARHYDLRLLAAVPDSVSMFGDTLKAGLAVLPANIVQRAFGDAPALALNAWIPGAAGAAAGGLFTIARKVSSLVQLVRTTFAYVLAPLASAAARDTEGQVRPIYGFATRVSFAVAVPMAAVLGAGSPAVLRVFGPEAAMATMALIAMTVARAIEAILGAATPIQQVIGGYRGQMIGSVAGIALAALIAWYSVPDHGLSAMAWAVAAGLIVAALIPVIQLEYYEGIHPFARPFGRMAMTAMAVSAAGFLFGLAATRLPFVAQLPVLLLILLAALWLTLRLALPLEDREALGKTGRALRLA
jgi:O-antigen/teichoic acid export membrane protein